MRCMHKPVPKLGQTRQDKRSVVPIELADVEAWLGGTGEEASKLLRLAPVSLIAAGPARPEPDDPGRLPGHCVMALFVHRRLKTRRLRPAGCRRRQITA